ncbi:preprotein translocase [Tsukamurella spumae]|uniref:Preprotein translocase n=2 Tax=Tsukamurella spumae TaxID=44753 RepID=A0A846X1D5_9ACTN|nr:preprotein translocase [Tsukamurella spumae]
MRSRFAAYRDGDAAWLLSSWHPSTRPADLDLDEDVRWRGLQIVDTVDGGATDESGVVEFRATCLVDGELGVLHERSRFVREDGRWLYVDGDISTDPRPDTTRYRCIPATVPDATPNS